MAPDSSQQAEVPKVYRFPLRRSMLKFRMLIGSRLFSAGQAEHSNEKTRSNPHRRILSGFFSSMFIHI